jgi:preprotein translocase subunit SecB
MISPLQLNHFFTEELVVEDNPAYVPKGEKRKEGKCECQVEVGRATTVSGHYQVKLLVTVDPAQTSPAQDPYRIRIRLIGRFGFAKGIPEETMTHMANLNGSSILFGVARGIVAQVTGTGRSGGYLLPTVNFVEMFKEQSKEQSQPSGQKSPSPRSPKQKPSSRSKRSSALRK